jgi:hypothetical protein
MEVSGLQIRYKKYLENGHEEKPDLLREVRGGG